MVLSQLSLTLISTGAKLSILISPNYFERYVMLTPILTAQTFLKNLSFNMLGDTLLEGVCIRLTWYLHNHGICYEVLCIFLTTVIKCNSLNYDIFNANMTLFEMSLLWHLDINHYITTCQWQFDISKTTQPVINMT